MRTPGKASKTGLQESSQRLQNDALKKSLMETQQEMTDALAEFRALADAKELMHHASWRHRRIGCCVTVAIGVFGLEEFTDEMSIVQRRMEWLAAVFDDTKLNLLLQTAQADGGDGMTAAGGSRDMGALVRCGPFQGWESLESFQSFLDVANKFKPCQSAQEVKDVAAGGAALKKLLTALQSSCKASVAELASARTRKRNAEEALAKKEAAAAKKKAEAASKSGQRKPAVAALGLQNWWLSQDEYRPTVRTATACPEGWTTLEPLVLTGFMKGSMDKLVPGLRKELDDFAKIFAESSMKVSSACFRELSSGDLLPWALNVTGGRAARTCVDATIREGLRHAIKEAMPEEVFKDCHFDAPASSSNSDLAALQKVAKCKALISMHALNVQTFGLAAGHADTAISEIAWFATMRWSYTGTRTLVLLHTPYIQMFMAEACSKTLTLEECVAWVRNANMQDVSKFANYVKSRKQQFAEPFEPIQYATLGEFDVIITPSGWVYGLQVLQTADVIGVRQPFITHHDTDFLEKLALEKTDSVHVIAMKWLHQQGKMAKLSGKKSGVPEPKKDGEVPADPKKDGE
eukprot:3468300-Amphidinium_carterae.1